MIAAMGLDHPSELRPELVVKRISDSRVQTFAETYEFLNEGDLLEHRADARVQTPWDQTSAERFRPEFPPHVGYR